MTCTADDCECYPYWGREPGADYHEIVDGRVVFGQRERGDAPETWPANFRPDPEMPGFGTYFCPVCKDGMNG